MSVLPQQLLRVPPVSPRHMDENLRTSYSHNWFVGIERQILTHTVVEINYAGTAAFKLSATNNINRFQENGLRINTRIANDNYRAGLANSHYNSLQLGVKQRYNKGFSYQGSYTWAHAIDQISDAFVVNSLSDLGFREAFNARGDYGSADFDRRHRFILNLHVPF